MQPVAPQQHYGQPTPVGQVVPILVTSHEHAIKLDLDQVLTLHGEQFYFDAPTCSEQCKSTCCPFSMSVDFKSDKGSHLEFSNGCVIGPPCCRQKWKASVNDRVIGYTNGYKKKCCKCDCLSNISIQEFRGPDKKVKYTIKKQNDCMSCMCSCIFEQCVPLGKSIRSCSDSCSYLKDKQYVVSREDIMDATGDIKVGEIIQVHRLVPVGCIVMRKAIKYQVNVNTPQVAEDLAMLGLLPMFYNGLPVPWTCCILPPAAPLSGVSCADRGRNGEIYRTNMDGYLKSIKPPSSVKMAR